MGVHRGWCYRAQFAPARLGFVRRFVFVFEMLAPSRALVCRVPFRTRLGCRKSHSYSRPCLLTRRIRFRLRMSERLPGLGPNLPRNCISKCAHSSASNQSKFAGKPSAAKSSPCTTTRTFRSRWKKRNNSLCVVFQCPLVGLGLDGTRGHVASLSPRHPSPRWLAHAYVLLGFAYVLLSIA